MPWVAIDDLLPEHTKVLAVNDSRAMWLHICALCYSARNLTDGHVPRAIVARLVDHRRPYELAGKLVAAGLWHEADGGYEIHDYLHYQPSRAKVIAEREAGKKRAADSYQRRKTFADSSGEETPKTSEESGGSSPILRATPPLPSPPLPNASSSRDSSTAITGVGAAAVELYAHADMATRSVTDIRNARSYRRSIAQNAVAKYADEIAAYVERYPACTPVDVAVEVLGVPRHDALAAWAETHPESAS